MKLYGRTTSFNVQKVLWLLTELNLDFQHIELGGRFGGLDNCEFKQLNPMGKVPVLVDNGRAVWESHTILRYLAAQYGSPTWYSACAFERSLYERWLDWSQTIFQPAFMGTFWGYYRMPPNKRDMVAVNRHLDSCINCLATINKQLQQTSYLAGNTLSLADIVVGAVIYRLTSQGLEIPLPEHVSNWYQKLKSRPGYKTWVMSDFTELKAREDF
ncbi:glutathione S-transferase family protein [Pseudoalteromonas spongiae]|uniref:Glutathione S-transferase family protein n=1 Tax=Pseudoalteromonas spongiae TaxID=298657 RepID=A0ABU8EWD7_9GAMM